MRAVITGATGLVGSHLVAHLLGVSDWEVHCTARSEHSLTKLKAVCDDFGADYSKLLIHNIELEDSSKLSQFFEEVSPDVVFHTAAIVSLDGSDESTMIRSNVELAASVADALLSLRSKGKSPLLVHTSSIAALGCRPYPELTTEECQVENIASISAYSKSKFLSENEIWRAAKMGLRVVVVNPSVVVGVTGDGTDRSGLQNVFELASCGLPGYTRGVMGFVDVRDVAAAMYELALSAQSGRAEVESQKYILSGVNLNYKEFITVFNQAFGKKKPFLYVSKPLLKSGVWLLGVYAKIVGRKPLIAPPMIGFMTDRTLYEGSKVERTLVGFKYSDFSDSAKMVARRFKKK